MKAAWITRSFLDYRVPVYRELDALLGGEFALFFNKDVVPARVTAKAKQALGDRAVGLSGEWRVGSSDMHRVANRGLRVPWQPGLLREVRRHSPDVLITDGFFQWTAAALWLRMRDHIPHVVCYERNEHTERNAQWYRRLYRSWVLRYVDAMCCSGRLCGEYARGIGMRADRITYGHMVADTETLRVSALEAKLEAGAAIARQFGMKVVCLLYVGRLAGRKGVRQLLGGWAKVSPSERGGAWLLLVGDGPDGAVLQEFCRSANLRDVIFAGAVDYDALPRYYAAADAFVIPTLEDNWSLVVPEAMACGLPILCSKYNGCWPELVHHEKNGWVFDPLDIDDIARCLTECLRRRSELPLMGQRSVQLLSGHTARDAAQAILDACHLARSGRHPLPAVELGFQPGGLHAPDPPKVRDL